MLAIEKLDREFGEFKGDTKAMVVAPYVLQVIKDWCKDETFAQAVVESTKTFSDVLKEINIQGNHVSDFLVYKKAALVYFPEAIVRFNLEIEINNTHTMANPPEAVTPIVPVRAAAPEGREFTPAEEKKVAAPKPKAEKKGVIQISLFGGEDE